MSSVRENVPNPATPVSSRMEVSPLRPGHHWLPFQRDLAAHRGWYALDDRSGADCYRNESIIICTTCPDYCDTQCSSVCTPLAERK